MKEAEGIFSGIVFSVLIWLALAVFILLFISGCGYKEEYSTMVEYNESFTKKCQEMEVSLRETIDKQRSNITELAKRPKECIKINKTDCPICITCSESYLTLDEYTKMSVRIKSLEKMLGDTNNTDYLRELRDNATTFEREWLECNKSLTAIKELI